MFLGLPDPDPLVRGMDPAPNLDPFLFSQSDRTEIKFEHKILAKKLIFKTEHNMPAGKF
jgi:hypothetical protein